MSNTLFNIGDGFESVTDRGVIPFKVYYSPRYEGQFFGLSLQNWLKPEENVTESTPNIFRIDTLFLVTHLVNPQEQHYALSFDTADAIVKHFDGNAYYTVVEPLVRRTDRLLALVKLTPLNKLTALCDSVNVKDLQIVVQRIENIALDLAVRKAVYIDTYSYTRDHDTAVKEQNRKSNKVRTAYGFNETLNVNF